MCNEIITALIGVGATIVGTVLGWMLNNLSNKGKLNIFVSSWEDSFKHNNFLGQMIPCSKCSEVECYSYKTSLDIYNSSGNTRIMRNVQIIFSDGKHDLRKETPKDDATERVSSLIIYYDDVGPINIPPKKAINVVLRGEAWNNDGELDFIWKSKKIYLTYTNEKNKIRRKLLKIEDYENYFDTHKQEDK